MNKIVLMIQDVFQVIFVRNLGKTHDHGYLKMAYRYLLGFKYLINSETSKHTIRTVV